MNAGVGVDPRIRLSGSNRTVPGLLTEAGKSFGNKVAWTDGDRYLRFSELPILAARGAASLQERGLDAGDRFLVISENRLEVLELLIAAARLGAIMVPINPATPAQQLNDFMDLVEPKHVFADTPSLNDLERGLPWEDIRGVLDSRDQNELSLQDHEDKSPDPLHMPQTPLAILLTSGTTGASKGVICPQGQFVAWGETVTRMLALTDDDVAYTNLPLFHTNALNAAFQCLVTGATFHIGPRFSTSRFWKRVIEADATVTYLLGAMVGMLLNTEVSESETKHRVSRILAPGTPVSALQAFEARFGPTLVEGHGMTETNATIGNLYGERRLGYMGRVMPGYQAQIVDEFDQPVPDGHPGELVVRSDLPYAFATGYWKLPDITLQANRNQWFHSGDRVVCDDGWFRFLDRIKDVIRRRGENISAWEVEQALESHPQVARAAVVPVPSDLGEDEVMAFILPVAPLIPKNDELLVHCESRLPRYAIPRYIEIITELPLTETGKVRKQVLRERGVGIETWDANSGEHARR